MVLIGDWGAQVSIKAQVVFDACWRRCEERFGEVRGTAARHTDIIIVIRSLHDLVEASIDSLTHSDAYS